MQVGKRGGGFGVRVGAAAKYWPLQPAETEACMQGGKRVGGFGGEGGGGGQGGGRGGAGGRVLGVRMSAQARGVQGSW